ncbi:MAG TPA: Crp/Fnr family transcriptional regulator [Puia sp.]|nr:Crp/Fnr family transcriptional regulator [Puia sp.]
MEALEHFNGFCLNFDPEFNSMQAKEILKQHIAKTALLTDHECDYFFSHFKLQSYKKGQIIITQGDKVDCEYFVVDGCLKSFYINDDMKMFVLQFAMPTWWASDYNALYSGEKAMINVDCITNAEVLCLSGIDREKLCREIHQVEHFFRWRTNKGYVAAQRRLLSHMNNDAKQRYEELMMQYPALYNIVPKHLIAAYLGVSRETLSRLYHS